LHGGELFLSDLAELQPHLRGEQLLAQNAVVVELAVDGSGDLVQHELDAADEQRVENDHGRASCGPATAAITAASASGATGLGTCMANPASSARARSSTRG